ncbi:MAG: hypothetical protein RL037_235 [Bacteroidota bacterium]|jgi:hypothetical protein
MFKFLLSCFFLLSTTISFSQVDQSYKTKVKQMMLSSGGADAYDAAITQMFTMYQQQFPNVPANFWNEFEQEFMKTSMDELVTLIAPVYANHLSSQDLDQIIAFYATPAGKKLSSSQGAITTESMSVGQEWGVRLGEKVGKKLKDKGY